MSSRVPPAAGPGCVWELGKTSWGADGIVCGQRNSGNWDRQRNHCRVCYPLTLPSPGEGEGTSDGDFFADFRRPGRGESGRSAGVGGCGWSGGSIRLGGVPVRQNPQRTHSTGLRAGGGAVSGLVPGPGAGFASNRSARCGGLFGLDARLGAYEKVASGRAAALFRPVGHPARRHPEPGGLPTRLNSGER
jgi:hypothetical protein